MYRLLIVDDEPLMRRGIKLLADLKRLGIEEVHEASNGNEAMVLMNQVTFDIILLDINMPQMDGLTFAEKAKKLQPKVRICIITGYDYFEYAQKALKAGVEDYILKPVSKTDIEEVLNKMIKLITNESVHAEIETLKTNVSEDLDHTNLEVKLKNEVASNIYEPDFSLVALAEIMGFSTGHLSNIFKSIYGIPFKDYVIKQRMDRAKVLLLTTDMKNYEISREIGIEDVNYFATRFKKTTQLTPKQYKEKVRGQ